tara:strand:- start:34107 stop:35015 length:909 start_codon:yes stop_codon:yes gene_type:complete
MSFNFNQKNDGTALLKYSVGVYLKALPKTFLLSALIIGVLYLIRVAPEWIPAAYQEDVSLGIMFAYIAILPILSLIFYTTDTSAKQTQHTLTEYLILPFKRILSLFGSLISMCLLPIIIAVFGFAVFLLSIKFTVDVRLIFFIPLFFYGLVFLSLLPKLYAPILTITDNMDTNTALETSIAASKGYFIRNAIYIGFGVTLLLGICALPNLLQYYCPAIISNLPKWAPLTMSAVLFVFIFPWVAAILICHKIDLLYRYKIKKEQEAIDLKKNFAYEHKIKKAGANIIEDQKQVKPMDNNDVEF